MVRHEVNKMEKLQEGDIDMQIRVIEEARKEYELSKESFSEFMSKYHKIEVVRSRCFD